MNEALRCPRCGDGRGAVFSDTVCASCEADHIASNIAALSASGCVVLTPEQVEQVREALRAQAPHNRTRVDIGRGLLEWQHLPEHCTACNALSSLPPQLRPGTGRSSE